MVSAEIAELVVRVEYEAAVESTVRLLKEAAEIWRRRHARFGRPAGQLSEDFAEGRDMDPAVRGE